MLESGKLIGLQNLGLTCFLNSLLQALAACPSFLDWLEPCEGNGYVSSSLCNILRGNATHSKIIHSLLV